MVSAARCGATGSGRYAADRAGEPLHRAPPFTPSVTLYAREGQAVVCPLLRGRSPTRSVAPKQPTASGVLSLRHFGLACGCRRIWRGEVSGKQGRLLANRPCSSLVSEESDSKERLRVSNWIVQRLH